MKSNLNFPSPTWRTPPVNLSLNHSLVDVWRSTVECRPSKVRGLLSCLSVDERTRAERFYFQRDWRRFVFARGLLRCLLGRYLKMEPNQIRFSYNSYGKPALAYDCGGDTICFNISHSNELILCAVAYGRKLGIDIEYIRPDFATDQIAQRFFAQEEVAALRELPKCNQAESFFTCWTRKEAYIKAKGRGLTLPLDSFVVSLAPDEPVSLLSTTESVLEASRWSFEQLSPGLGYVATLAVEGSGYTLQCWQCNL